LIARKERRQWPFLLGNRLEAEESGFIIHPDRVLRDPYRFSVIGVMTDEFTWRFEVTLGAGVLIEAFVVVGTAVVFLGGVFIALTSNTGNRLDWSPLLLGTPFVIVVSIGLLSRAWIRMRASDLIADLRKQL
jgi:hypothetical protein